MIALFQCSGLRASGFMCLLAVDWIFGAYACSKFTKKDRLIWRMGIEVSLTWIKKIQYFSKLAMMIKENTR